MTSCPRCDEHRAIAAHPRAVPFKTYQLNPHESHARKTPLYVCVECGYDIARRSGRSPVWNDATDERFVNTLNAHEFVAEHLAHVLPYLYKFGLMITAELVVEVTGGVEPVNALVDGNHRAAAMLKVYGRAVYYLLTAEETRECLFESLAALAAHALNRHGILLPLGESEVRPA